MVSLKESCGLEIELNPAKTELIFAPTLNFSLPAVRTLDQMRQVILDRDILEPKQLYYMYRDVYILSDKPLLEKAKLRYDVTLLKPDRLGRELMKTAGHYHPASYGELYEVVYGRCFCLLQRPNLKDPQIIEEVILVEAEKGDNLVIPPGFGHILINPGPQYLVTSNWVSSSFSSEYALYREARGAAYFVIKNKEEKTEFHPNAYFSRLPEIKKVRPAPHLDRFGLVKGKPIYPLIEQEAEKLDFLNHPLDFDYQDVFI